MNKEIISLGLSDISDVNDKEHSFWATAITNGPLRHRDFTVTMDGWKLDNFWKNPLFLLNHDDDNMPETLLGRVAEIEIKQDRMRFKPVFAVGIAPWAETVFRLYKEGFMRAFSVQFVPSKEEIKREGDVEKRIFTEKELIEISAVSIPADPNALKEKLCQARDCVAISNHQRRELLRLMLQSQDIGNISEEDKKGIYRHVARHCEQFDKEVPELALKRLIFDFGNCLQKLETMGALLEKKETKDGL